jgi:eukaryotic-like serine/threonine-protein kinase
MTPVLHPGEHLGPYQIGSPLGEGGMGAVFKARDTRLGRTVAVKIVKGEFNERFDREARAISALNHPHICALYDVGVHDGTPYLVMEYVEGAVIQGPLPIERALLYGAQIADALDAAHRSGIVHRDLKPANVLVTRRGVKLLDFGIAKFAGAEPLVKSDITGTLDGAQVNAVVGTPQYMAPEQIQARRVDARSDIFALGCVLYEMISGQKAFAGDSPTAVTAAILAVQPAPLSKLVPGISPSVERTVNKCLAKEPDERWQTARDLKDELEWFAKARDPEVGPKPRLTRTGIATLLVGLMLLLSGFYLLVRQHASSFKAPYRFSIYPAHGSVFTGSRATISAPEFAVSPNGSQLVYVATTRENTSALWLQPLDRLTPSLIANTEDASHPFWSPDGRSLGFFAQGKLKTLRLDGGPARIICDAGTDFRSGSWASSGDILFSVSNNVIFRVPEGGGQPAAVTRIDTAKGEAVHRWPFLLPDEQRFLYFIRSSDPDWRGVFIGSLNDPAFKKPILTVNHSSVYADGYLLYLEDSTLMARRFDAERLSISGSPVLIAEQVQGSTNTRAAISVSRNGVLAYASAAIVPSRPTWYDRSGIAISTLSPVADYIDIRLSPDGHQAAFTRQDTTGPAPDIWVQDFDRGTVSRLTATPTLDSSPIWAEDGASIYFRSNRTGFAQIYRAEVTDPSRVEIVLPQNASTAEYSNTVPGDVSRDGAWLVFTAASETGSFDLWTIDLKQRSNRIPYLSLPANEIDPVVSPDGRFLAYASDETGRYEVYVQTFPKPGRRWQISSTGGTEPRWRGDGAELYYLSTDKKIMATSVSAPAGRSVPELHVSPPVALFPVRTPAASVYRRSYDVTRDGKRFLVNILEADVPAPAIHVLLNWTALLPK